MNTRREDLAHEVISWLTISSVMPPAAGPRMASGTSLSELGVERRGDFCPARISSFKGQEARAMATRCCWPPDSWSG
jgi:hypothetical protein